jgi:hypothetical protein
MSIVRDSGLTSERPYKREEKFKVRVSGLATDKGEVPHVLRYQGAGVKPRRSHLARTVSDVVLKEVGKAGGSAAEKLEIAFRVRCCNATRAPRNHFFIVSVDVGANTVDLSSRTLFPSRSCTQRSL